jgi:hypothetical protein
LIIESRPFVFQSPSLPPRCHQGVPAGSSGILSFL